MRRPLSATAWRPAGLTWMTKCNMNAVAPFLIAFHFNIGNGVGGKCFLGWAEIHWKSVCNCNALKRHSLCDFGQKCAASHVRFVPFLRPFSHGKGLFVVVKSRSWGWFLRLSLFRKAVFCVPDDGFSGCKRPPPAHRKGTDWPPGVLFRNIFPTFCVWHIVMPFLPFGCKLYNRGVLKP